MQRGPRTSYVATGVTDAVWTLLSDGNWHNLDEIVTVIRPLIRPEVLFKVHRHTCGDARNGRECSHEPAHLRYMALRTKGTLIANRMGAERTGPNGSRLWRIRPTQC